MALEDFERELAKEQASSSKKKRDRSRSRDRKDHKHSHSRHQSSKHRHSHEDDHKSQHRKKRRKSDEQEDQSGSRREHKSSRGDREKDQEHRKHDSDRDGSKPLPGKELIEDTMGIDPEPTKKRDDWMQDPARVGIDYVQQKKKEPERTAFVGAKEKDFKIEKSDKEMNKHRDNVEDGESEASGYLNHLEQPAQHEVNYVFGDQGSAWRMTKLKNVFRQAKESGRNVEEVAVERFGDLRSFDDAREEEIELERRKTYGKDYVGKEKPSGELFQDRKLDNGIRRGSEKHDDESSEDEFEAAQAEVLNQKPPPAQTVALDQSALNRLKAQLMKAKLKKSPDAAQLQTEYDAALAASANNRQADVVVLNKMEDRMLAGGREGEVKRVENKRGRERGLVQENEDMSIDDMLRQEKRTRLQAGGSGKAFAASIAKDSKFDNDLEYMEENANKLAKSVQKSDINLRNTAIGDYQKMKKVLDNCPLCHHEDTSTPPQAPLVSLATRTFLTLPTSPEITPYGLCASIVPIQHRLNLLECDDDEWEEIRNFMKSLARFYFSQKLHVIFYENAAHEGRKRHASLEAVPLPLKFSETAPQFFKEAILVADEEWSQHRKIIDTQAKAETGLGKRAFRNSMVSELPYFHAWFTLDGGLGHVVEDPRRWPKGDLFAREIIGGILDRGPDVIKKQGRWRKGDPEIDERVRKFRKHWEKHDWTSVLMDVQ